MIMASGRGEERREEWLRHRQRQEFLPRDVILGGYIFLCDDNTMKETFDRHLFGLPEFYRDSVRTITPGIPLFLYNSTTRHLYGTFEAASFGNYNIDPTAWQDNNGADNSPRSRYPAQVCVRPRRMFPPLPEAIFRPLIHHYAPYRFRLPMTVPEALNIMDAFHLNGGFFRHHWNVCYYWNGHYWIPTLERVIYI